MADLNVYLFGGLRIEVAGTSLSHRLGPQSQEILAYLVLHRDRLHPRDRLMTMFWGDRTDRNARRCLSTALWRLQRKLDLRSCGKVGSFLEMQGSDIGWNQTSGLWLDVDMFKAAARRLSADSPASLTSAQAREAEDALALYRGDILEGCFSDWAIAERERLHLLRLSMMQTLMRYHADRRDAEAAIRLGDAILSDDPLREDVHRDLIAIMAASGDRAGAHRQYQRCCALLRDELDIEPLPETTRTYETIDGTSSLASSKVTPVGGLEDEHMQRAMTALHDGLASLSTFAHELEKLLIRADKH